MTQCQLIVYKPHIVDLAGRALCPAAIWRATIYLCDESAHPSCDAQVCVNVCRVRTRLVGASEYKWSQIIINAPRPTGECHVCSRGVRF